MTVVADAWTKRSWVEQIANTLVNANCGTPSVTACNNSDGCEFGIGGNKISPYYGGNNWSCGA